MDLAIERLQGGIERLQSDTLHAYDSGYVPLDRRAAALADEPSPQANLDAPLPCEAPPGSFLVLDDDDGRRRYVRGVNLAVRHGTIVEDEGRPILGYPEGAAPGVLGALRIGRRDAVLARATALRIERDGRVAYGRRVADAEGTMTTQWVSVGRLALATLDGGVAHLAPPGEEGHPMLAVPRQQGGRVDLPRALERLQEAYLQLDALRAARAAEDGGERTALGVVK